MGRDTYGEYYSWSRDSSRICLVAADEDGDYEIYAIRPVAGLSADCPG